MPKPSSQHFDAAKRLLAHESLGTAGESVAVVAGRVQERLSRALSPVIGAAGAHALFARSVRLSAAEFPCLAEMLGSQSPPADEPRRLADTLGRLEQEAAREVAVALFAAMLGLMSTFIGERMVWQIVRTAFPRLDVAGPKETK